MQACLRSSLSNAESEDGDIEFMWFGNFWWKYSHCKMSVIQLVLKKSTRFLSRNRPLLRGGSRWKRDGSGWGGKLPSGPLSGLAWFEWETWILVSSCQPSHLLAKLFGDFLCSAGKSRAFLSLHLKADELRTHMDSARQIFKIKSSLACRDYMSYLITTLLSQDFLL